MDGRSVGSGGSGLAVLNATQLMLSMSLGRWWWW